MNQMDITVSPILWQETIYLRHKVLWPTKPPEYCHVDGDKDALHFGAFVNGVLVSVASIYSTNQVARLRKFATLPDYQHQGIGSQLLTHIIKELKKNNHTYFWCDARESALAFYQRFGMQKSGERFYKSEVAYFKMGMTI